MLLFRRLGLLLLWVLWAGPAAAGPAQVTVQLNWKHQFEFAAFYAAEAQGYYRDAGLQVDLREGGPGIDAVKEVVDGHADFGVGTSALVVERHHGKPVVALASLMQHSPIALLALRRNGVNSVHDLADRPVAVDPHSRDEIDAYLRAAGIPAARIRFVDQTDWTLQSLEEGRESAKVVYLSNEPFFIRGREHEFVLLRPASAGIDMFGNMLFATQSTLDARPEVVRAFRAATLKGLVHALAHPEAVTALILERWNTQGKSREHLLYEAAQMHGLTRPDIVEPGYMSRGRWQHVAAVYAGQNKLPAGFDLTGFLYEESPPPAPSWLAPALAAAVAALLATAFVVLKFRRLNAELEQRVAARTADAERARDDAQRLAQAKSEFLANMSHEIRTPLNAVLGFARIGVRDGAGQPGHETFARIQRAGEHLLGVINDVLDCSRIEAGRMSVELRPFRLGGALDHALGLVADAAARKGLALTLEVAPDLPPWVVGDAQRLQQVLANLLSNAVKFTEQGGVRVAVSRLGDDTRFEVADSGIGMSPEVLARLFQPFEQADSSTTRRFGGSGLGLAISRSLARLMGGEITVSSGVGTGSRFVLSLPLQRALPALPPPATGTSGTRLKGVRILAAEDVEVNRLILEDLLVREGAHVVFAGDGRQVLERIEELGATHFDLVLMDVQMPGMDGCETARCLRDLAPGLPVLALTAHAMPEERQRCLDAGMVGHLSKPVDVEALVQMVSAWTRRPHPRAEVLPQPPSAAAGTLPARPPSIDRDALLALFRGQQPVVERVLASARTVLGDLPAQLRAAADSGDLPRLKALAHDVKGTAGALKAAGPTELAARCEAAARTGAADAADRARDLARIVEDLLLELAQFTAPPVADAVQAG